MTALKSKVEKSFRIDKRVVWEAWQQVRANQGAPGIDEEAISKFERNLQGNLYVLWNRLSSGSYMPPPVKAVQIPKKDGRGVRTLGVPTVADRVAQTVAKLYLEPEVEPIFHPDSYGYRPNRSALDAVRVCRERCWKSDWVIDFDLRSFFDLVDHQLILKAVAAHTKERWVLLYVERWLKAPLDNGDGDLKERDRGTPQGSAISPVLANIYLHYAFDSWMAREFPDVHFERYADDAVVHCKSERQAQFVLGAIEKRMADCHLALSQEKTRIVCVSRGCVELAGESPATVMTKQPCSWWAVEGETRLSKPHDKAAFVGGEQAYGPYDEESCVSVVRVPARAGRSGSRASTRWAKAREGAKTLEVQHRGTRRRIGIGTCAQFNTERERSVSAPAFTAPGCQPEVLREVAIPITGNTGKRWSAERKSEEAVVAMIGVDNITRRSEGPLARCAIKQRPRLNAAEEPRRSLGPVTNAVASGMPPVDCLGESRVRENFMHGLGRGGRNRTDDAQPLRSLGGISVARLSPTSHCKDSNRTGSHEHERFDFLGYTFRPRQAKNHRGELFTSFLPAVSDGAAKQIRRTIRKWRIHLWSGTSLTGIAQACNKIVRGWINYYGHFYPDELNRSLRHIEEYLVRWAVRKFKRLKGSRKRGWKLLADVSAREPELFAHWRLTRTSGRMVGAV